MSSSSNLLTLLTFTIDYKASLLDGRRDEYIQFRAQYLMLDQTFCHETGTVTTR